MAANGKAVAMSGNDKKRKPDHAPQSLDQQNRKPVSETMSSVTHKRQKMNDAGALPSQNTNAVNNSAEISPLNVSSQVTLGNSLNGFGRVDTERLHEIIKTKVISNLLLDCRNARSYYKERLRYSLNIPLSSDKDNKCWSFNSKHDVIMFLKDCHPNIFGYLHSPGFYTYIIVFDQDSTFKAIPKPLNVLLDALVKWNENTRTKVLFVDGGTKKCLFSCNQIIVNEKASIGWTFPAIFNTYEKPDAQNKDEESDEETSEDENKDEESDEETSEDEHNNADCDENDAGVINKEILVETNGDTQVTDPGTTTLICEAVNHPLSVESFCTHLKNLDAATQNTWLVLVTKKQLMSLEGIKLALLKEERNKLSILFQRLITDNLRCSVCRKMYSGKIFQCPSGHGLCEKCTHTATICPKCQTSCNIGTKNLIIIRNTMMENMISTMYKVECPYTSFGCNMKLTVQKLWAHMCNCPNTPENQSLSIIFGYIDLMKKEMSSLNQQLEVNNKEMLESEQQFFSAGIQMTTNLPIKSIGDFKKKVNDLTKARTAVIREIFSNGEAVTEKCNIFK